MLTHDDSSQSFAHESLQANINSLNIVIHKFKINIFNYIIDIVSTFSLYIVKIKLLTIHKPSSSFFPNTNNVNI